MLNFNPKSSNLRLVFSSLFVREIANNNKRLNRQCPAWNEKRVRSFFDIKAGGVGIWRKFWRSESYFITNGWPQFT
jgi:hypothetical protein